MFSAKRVLLLIALLLIAILSVSAVGAQSSSRSYLILANGNSLPSNLESQVAAAGGQINRVMREVGIAVVESNSSNFASRIQGVRSVIPNLSIQWIPDLRTVALTESVVNPPNAIENDPLFNLQWNHDSVNSREAWNAGQRGAGVVVAVLDTGFHVNHPDLSPNLIAAVSFVPGEGPVFSPPGGFSHGTHVAGTVASPDNGIGGIGIAPEAKIVGVKVLSDAGSGSFDSVIAGILYAANRGDVDIINMSLSGSLVRSGVPGEYTAREAAELLVATSRATTYATQRGITVIAAAGNAGIDLDHTANFVVIPAQSTNVLAIAAAGPMGWAINPNTNLYRPASYTNYGRSAVAFGGPGGDFALPGEDPCVVIGIVRPCWVFDMVLSTASATGYGWAAGTSMAAPAAAGVAAIIIGENGGSMHPAQVKTELLRRGFGRGNNPYSGNGHVQTGY